MRLARRVDPATTSTLYILTLDMDHMSVSDAIDTFAVALREAMTDSHDRGGHAINDRRALETVYAALEAISTCAEAKQL